MHDYYDYEELGERSRDAAIDSAIERLLAFFEESPRQLFYSTQIETRLEREFFHWIVGKGLLELANAGKIQRAPTIVQEKTINFYAHPKHRYWRREQQEMTALLERIFDPGFTHAVGRHGELMFDAALGRYGFRAEARNANIWSGRSWLETNHNLDRIVTRDGHTYGVEIKNTQNYISRDELQTKVRLCQHLGVTPLFIMRFAPKSYIHEVNKANGFVLLFEHQMYPMGHEALVAQVRNRLGLKVHSPNDVMEGDMQRLLNWHERRRAR
jgi:hypothetical protein